MGSGKSTVGHRLAARHRLRFVDLDRWIEERAGSSIPVIFEREGETGFRAREADALGDALSTSGPIVLATGGGVVLDRANRRALAAAGAAVVYLHGPPAALARRVAGDLHRPLLGDAPEESLSALLETRDHLYREVANGLVVDVDRPVAVVVDAVEEAAGFEPVTTGPVFYEPVPVGGGRDYQVHVGHGVRHHLGEVLPFGTRRAAVITQAAVPWTVDADVEARVFTVPDGEPAKELEVVGRLCSQLAQWGFTRRDVVVGLGGGVVTDLAGFVASVYHRGVGVVHVPTTLLGQIDAAVGGKCGVNLPEGKNLVGSFWQPLAVLCDTETLSTLPSEDHRAGLGELAKYHFLGGGELDRLDLPARVARCVRIKADVVAADETESGRRAILNYGHTLAHAIETASGYRIRHGLAVAIGLPYAARLAQLLGRIDEDRVAEHFRVLDAYALSSDLPVDLDPEELVPLFERDKKALDGVTFVLDGPDGVEPVVIEDPALLHRAFDVFQR